MPTMKEFARSEFYKALSEYENSIASGCGIVGASLTVHGAMGRAPTTAEARRWKSLVNAAFKRGRSAKHKQPDSTEE